MQHKLAVGWKVAAVISGALVLGLGWAIASPRVQIVYPEPKPPLEILLYEGADVEWEVRLSAQDMPKQLMEWGKALAQVKIAGHRLEGERALDVLAFYEKELSSWRRIFWTKPSESGGVRLFAKENAKGLQDYAVIAVQKTYEATEIFLALAQADSSPLELPIFEGAQAEWELLLTTQDLLGYLKRWIKEMIQELPLTSVRKPAPGPEFWQLFGLGADLIFPLLADLSEMRVIGYRIEGAKAPDVLAFYEQEFSQWRRNFWAKPEESGGVRLFTQGDESGLKELVAVGTWAFGFEHIVIEVVVLRVR